ncbi:MAG: hypothetical protein PHC51_07555 [bacterium]|nr:hypothetical protein [bacterium]
MMLSTEYVVMHPVQIMERAAKVILDMNYLEDYEQARRKGGVYVRLLVAGYLEVESSLQDTIVSTWPFIGDFDFLPPAEMFRKLVERIEQGAFESDHDKERRERVPPTEKERKKNLITRLIRYSLMLSGETTKDGLWRASLYDLAAEGYESWEVETIFPLLPKVGDLEYHYEKAFLALIGRTSPVMRLVWDILLAQDVSFNRLRELRNVVLPRWKAVFPGGPHKGENSSEAFAIRFQLEQLARYRRSANVVLRVDDLSEVDGKISKLSGNVRDLVKFVLYLKQARLSPPDERLTGAVEQMVRQTLRFAILSEDNLQDATHAWFLYRLLDEGIDVKVIRKVAAFDGPGEYFALDCASLISSIREVAEEFFDGIVVTREIEISVLRRAWAKARDRYIGRNKKALFELPGEDGFRELQAINARVGRLREKVS